MPEPRVTPRVAMVSGASRGIGRAVVERLTAAGFQVSAGIRDPRGLTPAENLLLHRYDADSVDSPQAWLDATIARFGRLDALVNAAGINAMFAVDDPDETALDQLLAINLKAPLRLSRLALPHLRATGQGRIVNVASLSGKRVANANAGYAISKFAVVALTHALRRAGFDDGVRATALCPGFVETDMTMAAQFPRDQMTKPQDLATIVELLLTLPNTTVIAELLVNCRLEPGV